MAHFNRAYGLITYPRPRFLSFQPRNVHFNYMPSTTLQYQTLLSSLKFQFQMIQETSLLGHHLDAQIDISIFKVMLENFNVIVARILVVHVIHGHNAVILAGKSHFSCSKSLPLHLFPQLQIFPSSFLTRLP